MRIERPEGNPRIHQHLRDTERYRNLNRSRHGETGPAILPNQSKPTHVLRCCRLTRCRIVPAIGPARGSAELFPLQEQTKNRVREIEVAPRFS